MLKPLKRGFNFDVYKIGTIIAYYIEEEPYNLLGKCDMKLNNILKNLAFVTILGASIFNTDNINESILICIYDNHGNCLIIQQIVFMSMNTSLIYNQNITINNNNYIIKPYFKCTLIKTFCNLLNNKNPNFNSFQIYSFIYFVSINRSLFNYLYYIFKNKHQYIISY